MPVFLQGRRAFFYHPCAADIAAATPYQSTASPIRALPTRAAPIRAAPAPLRPPVTPTLPRLPRCRRLSLLPFLVYPAAATCHSYPHFAYFAVAAFGYRGTARTAPSPAWSEMPPRTASLLQFCPEHRHGPRPFSCSTRRRTADPRPCSARGTKRRTEPHRGPSAAKKQPICRGSITAAALQPVRSVHAPETDPLRIVRAGISG